MGYLDDLEKHRDEEDERFEKTTEVLSNYPDLMDRYVKFSEARISAYESIISRMSELKNKDDSDEDFKEQFKELEEERLMAEYEFANGEKELIVAAVLRKQDEVERKQSEINHLEEETRILMKKKDYMDVGHKIYPNEPCPCGSGKKYKKCCGSPNRDIQEIKEELGSME